MLALAMVLSLLAAPPAEEAAYDWTVARDHYESYFYRLFSEEWGADAAQKHFRRTAKKTTLPTVELKVWPVDSRYGFYANSPGKLAKFTWLATGAGDWQRTRSQDEDTDKTLGALADMSYHFANGFNDDIMPQYCAPARGAVYAWKGTAACYFAVSAEYQEPGFWVALREIDGRVVIAGVLEQKKYVEEPEKERGLKPFLAAIEKQLAPKVTK